MSLPVDSAGNGSLGYRLEIEGWPCEFVTDPRITHASGADGRHVIGGLGWSELLVRDLVVMQESLLQADGIEFRITPEYEIRTDSGTVSTDWPTYYLSREVDPTDMLGAALTYDATTIVRLSGDVFGTGQVIHVGTEAMRTGSSGAVTRNIWGTLPQAHPLNSFDRLEWAKIYLSIPPTMEGRRAYLYAYGDADDVAGNGSIVWRGMVAAVPKLDDDGNAWIIDCDGATAVLNQNVAGSILEMHPIGIYHHGAAPFMLLVKYDGDFYGPYHYTAHDINEEKMVLNITTFIDSVVMVTVGAIAVLDSIALVKTRDQGLIITIERNASAGIDFDIVGGSAILGFFNTMVDDWQFDTTSLTAGARALSALVPSGNLLASSVYHVPLTRNAGGIVAAPFDYGGAPVSPLGPASGIIAGGWFNFGAAGLGTMFVETNVATYAANPPFRIYVDADPSGVESVYIPDTNKSDQFYQVTATGTSGSKFYVDLDDSFQLLPFFCGFLGSASTINALRKYAVGSLADFVTGLKLRGRDFGNAGDTPFITDADLTDFTPTGPVQGVCLARVYMFIKQRRVDDILKEECKLANHFMRLESDGTIGIAPLPSWTEATPVDELHTIGLESIITPPDGFWPKWSPNSNGHVTAVTIQHDYSPRTDEHLDKPAVFTAYHVIPVSKGRGKAEASIKPYSTPIFPELDGQHNEQLKDIAAALFRLFAGNAGTVVIAVPYTTFGILCGDIVSLTHPLIPAGDGTKGVVGRRGVVIERRWNLDPARKDRGELTVQLTGRAVVGYAPSAAITDRTNTSGNTWVLQVSSANALNQAMATYANGETTGVERHFAIGDFVRVQVMDTYTEFESTGVVTAVSSTPVEQETVTVLFDAVWDPGDEEAVSWILEYQVDDSATATSSQRRYAYVADAVTQALPDGTFGRAFN